MICHLKAALYMWLLVTRRTVFSSEMTSYRTAWQSYRLRLIHALLINRPNFHGDEPSQLWSKNKSLLRNSPNHKSQFTNFMYFFIPIMKIRLNRWESKLLWLTWFPNSFGPRLMQTTVLGRYCKERLSHKTPSLHLFLYLENLFPSAPLHFFLR